MVISHFQDDSGVSLKTMQSHWDPRGWGWEGVGRCTVDLTAGCQMYLTVVTGSKESKPI